MRSSCLACLLEEVADDRPDKEGMAFRTMRQGQEVAAEAKDLSNSLALGAELACRFVSWAMPYEAEGLEVPLPNQGRSWVEEVVESSD